jgi:hypothetical protein
MKGGERIGLLHYHWRGCDGQGSAGPALAGIGWASTGRDRLGQHWQGSDRHSPEQTVLARHGPDRIGLTDRN